MNNRMWAGVYYGRDDVRVEQIPIPTIHSEEVLVKVEVCGVCGTDLKKIHHGSLPGPRVFGHETSGTIVQVGQDVQGWSVGDRVAIMHHVPCCQSSCRYCRHRDYAQCPTYKLTGVTAGFEPAGGGYAEYVRVLPHCTRHGMVRIPDGISFEAATLVEPVNTVVKGLRRSKVEPSDAVVIFGQGPIGLLITKTAASMGALVVTVDPLPYRRKSSLRFGASLAVTPDEVSAGLTELGVADGADVAVIAVPHAAVLKSGMRSVRPGGSILLFAQTQLNDNVQLDVGEVCVNEKTVIGSYSSDITLQNEVAEMIWGGDYNVDELITHHYPLRDLNEAFATASHPMDGVLKVVVNVS